MNKPNVNIKPKWARYLAQDEDGKWAWFEELPTAQLGSASGYWVNKSGKWEECLDEVSPNWMNTLEEVK